jgi:alpha-ketoglutarate-dependent taurine dioxygenase
MPERCEVPETLRAVMPELHRRLSRIEGDLAEPDTQARIAAGLLERTEWREFVAALRPIGLRPLWLGPGLGVAAHDAAASRLLVGLAVTLFPRSVAPPYDVGGAAVTEVTPRGGSAPSHSQNDLEAPPHTAGFFEPVPPMAGLFACVRPHPGGGAETTVIDLERLLRVADPQHVCAWEEGAYRYSTSARLGRSEHPLRVLRQVAGLPFLRYRRRYTVCDGGSDAALDALDRLVNDPANVLAFPLAHDEILVHWNGTPHGRRAQVGSTPADPGQRRLLLRCRVQPARGWAELFTNG